MDGNDGNRTAIAIWGFGPHGQRLFYSIGCFGSGYRVSALFDRTPDGVDPKRVPQRMRVLPADELPALYRAGRFEKVLIGAGTPAGREDVRRQLAQWGIPELPEAAALGSFMPQAGDDRSGPAVLAKAAFLQPLLGRMCDAVSRELFITRLFMELTGNDGPFLDAAGRADGGGAFVLHELQQVMNQNGTARAVLFGGGADGAVNRRVLERCGIPVAAYCSLTPAEVPADWPGASRCIMPDLLCGSAFADCTVIVSSREKRARILSCLEELHVPTERIYEPAGTRRAVLAGIRAGQYFDVWEPKKQEIFVDCGAYDGQTIREFSAWCGGSFRAVHALEPLPQMEAKLAEAARELDGRAVYLHRCAAWEKEERLPFYLDREEAGSGIRRETSTAAQIFVRGVPLDALISGPVTFIKMDVEGSEMAALNGAERLIRTYRPRLAVSVYHRVLDAVYLARRILEMVPEYRLKLRHYGAGIFETVLYASVDDWEDEAPDDEKQGL